METVTFIRHFFKKERITSENTDIFFPKPDGSIPYQDVVSFSEMDSSKYLVYTMGKHIFPKNHDMTVSMQRWMIIFVTSGSLRCGSQTLVTGDFLVLPSTCTIVFSSKKDGARFYWCTTNDDMLISTLKESGWSDGEIMLGHTSNMPLIVELFEQTVYNFPMPCDHRMLLVGRFTCLFSYIAYSAVRQEKLSDQIFKRCLNRIESTQGNITVDYLAKHYFVSRRYLYTLFKEYKNMSPIEYIHAVRMQAADKYITSTELTVAEIAELAGYSNYSHFTRAYKKYFGMSPLERRREARAKAMIYDSPAEHARAEILFDE